MPGEEGRGREEKRRALGAPHCPSGVRKGGGGGEIGTRGGRWRQRMGWVVDSEKAFFSFAALFSSSVSWGWQMGHR